jgi:hypothetical protein
MIPTDFIELKEGITLTDEKVMIMPDKLIKLMNSYAEHRIEEAKAIELVKYSFSGRDFKDAVAIMEAHNEYKSGNKVKALTILIKANWGLFDAKRYCQEHFN